MIPMIVILNYMPGYWKELRCVCGGVGAGTGVDYLYWLK